ncbi:uncharacterized protein LOC125941481 [Dermacentor silvarum]|uniref:uncharacterized protein LOC125941481 n=1 Tax=Dermacentor silvarum TaxID=543639 RepID=UPI0021016D9D|nr:uncharacterized protein LOC125941481 [Dermacentor silvarum]
MRIPPIVGIDAGNACEMAACTWIFVLVLCIWMPLITSEEELTTTSGRELLIMRKSLRSAGERCKTFGQECNKNAECCTHRICYRYKCSIEYPRVSRSANRHANIGV